MTRIAEFKQITAVDKIKDLTNENKLQTVHTYLYKTNSVSKETRQQQSNLSVSEWLVPSRRQENLSVKGTNLCAIHPKRITIMPQPKDI